MRKPIRCEADIELLRECFNRNGDKDMMVHIEMTSIVEAACFCPSIWPEAWTRICKKNVLLESWGNLEFIKIRKESELFQIEQISPEWKELLAELIIKYNFSSDKFCDFQTLDIQTRTLSMSEGKEIGKLNFVEFNVRQAELQFNTEEVWVEKVQQRGAAVLFVESDKVNDKKILISKLVFGFFPEKGGTT